jgi:hypothetical protein
MNREQEHHALRRATNATMAATLGAKLARVSSDTGETSPDHQRALTTAEQVAVHLAGDYAVARRTGLADDIFRPGGDSFPGALRNLWAVMNHKPALYCPDAAELADYLAGIELARSTVDRCWLAIEHLAQLLLSGEKIDGARAHEIIDGNVAKAVA